MRPGILESLGKETASSGILNVVEDIVENFIDNIITSLKKDHQSEEENVIEEDRKSLDVLEQIVENFVEDLIESVWPEESEEGMVMSIFAELVESVGSEQMGEKGEKKIFG